MLVINKDAYSKGGILRIIVKLSWDRVRWILKDASKQKLRFLIGLLLCSVSIANRCVTMYTVQSFWVRKRAEALFVIVFSFLRSPEAVKFDS